MKELIVDGETWYFDARDFTLKNHQGLPARFKHTRPKDFLEKLVFNISNACNLSCRYCYADGVNYGMSNRLMTIATADEIISNLHQDGIRHIGRLILFGGEPFLNVPLFRYIIDQLAAFAKIDQIETVTNGTILTPKVKSLISDYQPFITVSLDGPREVHDKLRGKGSYDRTMAFISYLKSQAYPKFEVASTYTLVHLKHGYSRDAIRQFFTQLSVPYNLNDVFSQDKQLAIKERTFSLEAHKAYIDKSMSYIRALDDKQAISSVLYDVMMSLVYKSRMPVFCRDLSREVGQTYDVDGSFRACFRFWGRHDVDQIAYFNDKDRLDACRGCWCKDMCMICVANIMDGYASEINAQGEFVTCMKPEIMAYCLESIVREMQQGDIQQFVANFERFIRYA